MNLIHKVINKILSIYYRSSGERLLSYYKCGGVKIGEGTIIFDSKNILIDRVSSSMFSFLIMF